MSRGPVQILATVALAGSLTFNVAADANSISFSEIASIHRDVIVPVPGEIFNVLDKFAVDRRDWADQLSIPEKLDCRNRTHTALFLGSVVAEGFLAVEAEDSNAITKLGRAVLDLADSLGMKQDVLRHSKSIIDAANDGKWDVVRQEFDATRQTVRDVMERRRDDDLARCVSVGGWVRGTEVVTALIKGDFAKRKSDILHQPDLLKHFTETFRKMGKGGDRRRMKQLLSSLDRLEPLMSKESIKEEEVVEIHKICSELRKQTIAP